MFDPYPETRDHARKVAYLHPQTLITWQDAIRENRDTDLSPQWQTLSSGGVLPTFVASLRARLLQWRLTGSQRLSREATKPRQDTASGRHSPAR